MLNEFRSTYITWDKATRRIYSPVTANESDSNGRKLNIQVVNSGQVENLTGATLHLYWETKDKAQYGLDAFTASDISKGEFEIFYTTAMLSNVGELNATLVLVDSTGKVVSDWFKITVARGINEGAIESENSFSSLTQALIDISNLEQNYAPRLNDLTAQLQQTGSVVLSLNSRVGELGATSTFKGSDTNANILAKTDMQIGDEWFDKTNNQSLRWNGTIWTIVGSTIKLGDDAVTPDKIAAVKRKTGKNLFSASVATQGSYVSSDQGEIRTGVSSYSLSDYYEGEAGAVYRKTGTLFTAFYKEKGVLSSITKAVSGMTFTFPADAKFARSTIPTADLSTAMIVKGSDWPSSYIPYSEIYEFDKDVYEVKPNNVLTKPTRNLFDKTKVTFGGYYDATGTWVAVASYGLSDPIPVNEGEVLSKLTVGFSSWLDAEGEWMGSWHTTRQARVPKGAKYLRALTNTANADKEMVVRGYEYPVEYIPHTKTIFDNTLEALDTDQMRALTSNLYGKKWAYLGDSISDYLFSYPHLIAPKHNMTLTHMALSGRSMAKRGEHTDTQYPPLVSVYQNVPIDVEVITIWIGTNDKGSNVAIGDINSTDETTFLGAYNVMLTWLIENRPNAKILLITPMQRSDSLGQTGTPLIDYVNAVEQLGMKYGKRVLNMYKNSGIYVYSEVVKQKFIPDGLHPNDDGHENFIAPPIETAMLQI